MASIIKVDTIQDQNGNNIINEAANTITIGASGDTITIPSGATLANSGIVTGFQSTGIDDNATSTAITIDSSQNVGIGTASPADTLNIGAGTKFRATHTGSVYQQIYSSASGNFIYAYGDNLQLFADSGAISLKTIAAQPMIFQTNNSEAMRIDSSGNVGIGTSSPESLFHIESDSSDPTLRITNKTVAAIDTGPDIEFWNNPFTGTITNSYESGAIRVRKTTASNNTHDHYMSFWTRQNSPEGINERMRITNTGSVGINKIPDGSVNTLGFEVYSESANGSAVLIKRDGNTPLYINRGTNDGKLVSFFRSNVEQGDISISGSTVSYNGFTGTHWSRFIDNSTPNILRGTILESLDEMCDWYNLEFDVTTQDADGNDVTTTEKIPHVLADGQSVGDTVTYNHKGTDYQTTIVKEADIKHMKSKVSDTVDAKNVYGVFSSYDNDGEGYNDFYVASVGSFVVRIKANETIAKGDLLQSNGDGTAKVQTDDNVKSSSFAKVLSTTVIETYDDGSFIVPCSLMC